MPSRLGTILALGYLAVFLHAECYLLVSLKWNPNPEWMSGIFAIMVTMPWSLMLERVCNAIGYIEWYHRFASSPVLYGLLATVALLPGAAINAAIAYWIGKTIQGRPGGQAV